MDTVSHWIEAT